MHPDGLLPSAGTLLPSAGALLPGLPQAGGETLPFVFGPFVFGPCVFGPFGFGPFGFGPCGFGPFGFGPFGFGRGGIMALLQEFGGLGSRLDIPTNILLGTVLVVLGVAYMVGRILRKQPEGTVNPAVARKFVLRVRAWWTMCAILVAGFLAGELATIVLFGLVSFWALREFITMTPTRRGDHRTLFWTFFLFTPLQYVLIGFGQHYYGLFSIMIPVYASLFIPARIALSGDHKRFLERSAKIQAGLLICVYSLSYAPALLQLNLQTFQADQQQWVPWEGSMFGLLFYFILVTQLGDVFQYTWGLLLGRSVIAPSINTSRTWEGFFGGVATTTLIGALLFWVTPFQIWQSACMAMTIAIMGFAGNITMSAIKRDRGVQDYGTLVQGHAGVLDRIDSVCFAAPIFFHLTRYFFSILT